MLFSQIISMVSDECSGKVFFAVFISAIIEISTSRFLKIYEISDRATHGQRFAVKHFI